MALSTISVSIIFAPCLIHINQFTTRISPTTKKKTNLKNHLATPKRSMQKKTQTHQVPINHVDTHISSTHLVCCYNIYERTIIEIAAVFYTLKYKTNSMRSDDCRGVSSSFQCESGILSCRNIR